MDKMVKIFIGFGIVVALGLQFEPKPAAKPKPDICIIVQHWTASVDGSPAVRMDLDCQRRGTMSLVLTKGL